MLFDSYIFIFYFLPATLIGYFLCMRYKKFNSAIVWLVCASLFFYAWWNPKYLALLLLSIVVNYGIGRVLWTRAKTQKPNDKLLFFGILFNLLIIGYFKYTYFLITNINDIFSAGISFEPLILPLGISFFTFQKIAFLLDASRGEIKEYRFLDYCLFVTFFPQLIAGPIVQHKQIIPQLADPSRLKITSQTLSVGLTLFFIGLVKKIGLADNVAVYANAVFDAAGRGLNLSFWESWCGAFAYTLQLYFDFSGYSDMAIGLAYLFGITLPINFFSPYKAKSIIEFWRRWHITLSNFLKNYLYIALGGNRKGENRRYINLLLTMLLGGLWHGANWTFILWGALHGLYLIINHLWRKIFGTIEEEFSSFKRLLYSRLCHVITFFAVVVAWVPFRATNLHTAKSMLHSMFSLENFSLPKAILIKLPLLRDLVSMLGIQNRGMFHNGLAEWQYGIIWIITLLMLALWAPNSTQIMKQYFPAEEHSFLSKSKNYFVWKPSTIWACATAFAMWVCFILLAEESEFLYFQF